MVKMIFDVGLEYHFINMERREDMVGKYTQKCYRVQEKKIPENNVLSSWQKSWSCW